MAAKNLAVVMTISVYFSQYSLYVTQNVPVENHLSMAHKKSFSIVKKTYVSQAKCFYFGEESGEKNVTQHNFFLKKT